MGRYLNSSTPYALYQGETNQPYFVDKSLLLAELFPVLDAGNQHICITRPFWKNDHGQYDSCIFE